MRFFTAFSLLSLNEPLIIRNMFACILLQRQGIDFGGGVQRVILSGAKKLLVYCKMRCFALLSMTQSGRCAFPPLRQETGMTSSQLLEFPPFLLCYRGDERSTGVSPDQGRSEDDTLRSHTRG